MAYGTNSSLIGSGIDPRMFVQDFGGYAQADAMQAQGMANGIQSAVSGVAGGVGDYLKQQKDDKAKLKTGAAMIDAAAKMFPSQSDALSGYAQQLKDENVPLNQRAAMADQIAGLINMSVGEGRHQEDMKMRQQGFDLDKRRADQDFATSEYNAKAIQDAAAITAEQATTENVFLRDQVGKLQGSGLIDQATLAEIDAMKNPLAKHGAMQSIAKAVTPKAQPYRAAQTQEFSNPDGSKQIYERNPTTGTWELPRVAPDLTTFVANHEGFDPRAHSDSGQTSIGYGTKAKPGETQISKEEAQRRLNEELAMHSERVDKAIAATGASFTPNERDALISFDFNTGAGESVISRFGEDKPALVAKMAEYNKLDKGDKAPSQGLVNRRNDEIALFQKPVGYTPAKPEFTAKEYYDIDKDKKAAASTASDAMAKSETMISALKSLYRGRIADNGKVVDEYEHPGFTNLFGSNIGLPTGLAGTSGADARTQFEQIQGKGFIEAIQDMKGMGALSNAEGEKASAAFMGLNTRMSEDAAKRKILEIQSIVQQGIDRKKSGVAFDGTPMTPVNTRANNATRLQELNAAALGQTTQR